MEKTEIKTIISHITGQRGLRGKKTSLVLRTHLGPFSHEATGTINCHGKVNVVALEVPGQHEIGSGTDISKNIATVTFGVRRNTVLSSFLARGE